MIHRSDFSKETTGDTDSDDVVWLAGAFCRGFTRVSALPHFGNTSTPDIAMSLTCAQVWWTTPDIVLHECTSAFKVDATIAKYLQSKYEVRSCKLCPSELGLPMTEIDS
jgi:hypothetical protein